MTTTIYCAACHESIDEGEPALLLDSGLMLHAPCAHVGNPRIWEKLAQTIN